MRIGTKDFDFNQHFYVMGILNMTPDSFSDGGAYNDIEAALLQAERMAKEGADIIDIGGESTRPGYKKVSAEEEMSRIIPIVEKIKKNIEIPLSIDTQKSSVAREALMAGADMINDINGFCGDTSMAELVAAYDVPVCLMHSRDITAVCDGVGQVEKDLQHCLDIAAKYHVRKEQIIVDPGIGFGKTQEQNLMILQQLEKLLSLHCPILLGVSRKRVIGYALKLPVDKREEGTMAANVIGAMKGGSIFRVHDVEKNVRALRMTESILLGRFGMEEKWT